MAFGFIKKLVAKITGRKLSAPKGGKGSANAGAAKNGSANGRGRNGKRGRGGKVAITHKAAKQLHSCGEKVG